MSVIFQLFCAEDLQKLELEDLKALKSIALEALRPGSERKSLQQIKDAAGKDSLPEVALKLPENTKVPDETPEQIKAQVHEMLNERGEDVSQQLQASRKLSPFKFDGLTSRHFNRELKDQSEKEKEATKNQDTKEVTILNWAISCEANNLEFYAHLVRARKAAYEFFREKTGQRPKGPDSLYSPFNPSHPLYRYFSGFYDEGPR